ncbi:hypothetical protein [Sulfurimonas sp.]|uniref:hypothetical protein n=1 Tax=Sulfurimonas sp. TaxID=2022749 RepID=UPI00262F143F|nr:hypothetical protein [Sulfurimonas sp.]
MKFLFLLLTLFVSLYADVYTQKLYETVLGSIFKERPIVVFATGDVKATLQNSKMFDVVGNCKNAVVAVIGNDTSLEQRCKNIPIFATTHRNYMRILNAFGAFYWRKGRPQIHFREGELKMFHLHLSHDLQRFIDE